jgi:hypothetical protein
MSAEAFLAGATKSQVLIEGFRDAFFRYGGEVKEYFETLKERVSPDLTSTIVRILRALDEREREEHLRLARLLGKHARTRDS